jgi:hypothetical protein
MVQEMIVVVWHGNQSSFAVIAVYENAIIINLFNVFRSHTINLSLVAILRLHTESLELEQDEGDSGQTSETYFP